MMISITIVGLSIIVAISIQCTQALIAKDLAEFLFFETNFTVNEIGLDADGYIKWDDPEENDYKTAFDNSKLISASNCTTKLEDIERIEVKGNPLGEEEKSVKMWSRKLIKRKIPFFIRKFPNRPSYFYFCISPSNTVYVAGIAHAFPPLSNSYRKAEEDIHQLLMELANKNPELRKKYWKMD